MRVSVCVGVCVGKKKKVCGAAVLYCTATCTIRVSRPYNFFILSVPKKKEGKNCVLLGSCSRFGKTSHVLLEERKI